MSGGMEGATSASGLGSHRANKINRKLLDVEERQMMTVTGILFVFTAAFALWLLFNV